MHAMRRYPEHRYPSAAALRDDLDRLDTLDPAQYDLSVEAPMGGMAGADSAKRLWAWVALIGLRLRRHRGGHPGPDCPPSVVLSVLRRHGRRVV